MTNHNELHSTPELSEAEVTTSAQANNVTIIQRLGNFIDNYRQILNSMLFGLLAAIIVLGIYVLVLMPKPQQIGAVDVQMLMRDLTTTTFKTMVSNPNSPEETKQAAEQIKIGALKIEKAISIVATRDNIVLIQKQAFVYDKNVPDYTTEVRNEIARFK